MRDRRVFEWADFYNCLRAGYAAGPFSRPHVDEMGKRVCGGDTAAMLCAAVQLGEEGVGGRWVGRMGWEKKSEMRAG